MIKIPVSVGELFDKITILDIKREKITEADKQTIILKEYILLRKIAVKLDEKFDGFKHISFHINDEKNKILFERYKIVFLYRENPIEAAMSLALARKTSVFRKIFAQKEYFKKKFILDPEVVLELTLQAQKHYKYLEQIENPFVLSYEKLYS